MDTPANGGRGGNGLALVVRLLVTPLADTPAAAAAATAGSGGGGAGGGDTVGTAVAGGLAWQLCGNCPEDRVQQTAASLHWLISFVGHGEEHLRAAAAGFVGGAQAKGNTSGCVFGDGGGSEVVRSLVELSVESWLVQAQGLWTQLR